MIAAGLARGRLALVLDERQRRLLAGAAARLLGAGWADVGGAGVGYESFDGDGWVEGG